MKSGVTLSMIVRNESANLRRCLESAAEFMDVIQIVDTGSTDDTIAVAEKFGAEVFEIEWPDAFDEARNFGFDQVKTQWTFWLDADEWLIGDAGPIIRQAIKLWEASAYFVTRLDEREDGAIVPVQLLRLWRTHPAMRLVGVLHESFFPASIDQASDGRPALNAPIQIGHDGYRDPDAKQGKLERNVALLKKNIEEREATFYHEAQLYLAMMRVDDPEGIAGLRRLARQVLAEWPNHAGETMTPVALATVVNQMPDEEIQLDFARKCISLLHEAFAFSLNELYECYRAHMRRGEREMAHQTLLEIQRRGQTGDYERLNPIHPQLFESVDAELAAISKSNSTGNP